MVQRLRLIIIFLSIFLSLLPAWANAGPDDVLPITPQELRTFCLFATIHSRLESRPIGANAAARTGGKSYIALPNTTGPQSGIDRVITGFALLKTKEAYVQSGLSTRESVDAEFPEGLNELQQHTIHVNFLSNAFWDSPEKRDMDRGMMSPGLLQSLADAPIGHVLLGRV